VSLASDRRQTLAGPNSGPEDRTGRVMARFPKPSSNELIEIKRQTALNRRPSSASPAVESAHCFSLSRILRNCVSNLCRTSAMPSQNSGKLLNKQGIFIARFQSTRAAIGVQGIVGRSRSLWATVTLACPPIYASVTLHFRCLFAGDLIHWFHLKVTLARSVVAKS